MTTSPVSNRIGNVFLPVRDIEKARDWYCRLLGLPEGGEILFGHLFNVPTPEFAGLTLDSMPKWRDADGGLQTYRTPAFSFYTEDIEASFQFMKDNGIKLVTEIENGHWFVFKDLDGNLLMVCQ